METKVCNTCKKELPIRFFHKQRKEGRNYTHRGKCSICYSTYRKEKGWEKTRYERKLNQHGNAERAVHEDSKC
jgi:hypothetical protein